MSTLVDLVVNLSTNASPFNRGMSGARGTLGGFVGGITKGIAKLGAFGTALAGAAGVGSLSLLVSSSMEAVGTTARLADQIGSTTESLVGLGHAAKKMSGLDMGDFGDAISDMLERIGDVKLEEGGAAEIMQKLRLDAEKLAAMKPEDAFLSIADAIQGLGTQAEKLHAADTLFGSAGQRLVPLLNRGSEGIRELAGEAEALGLTFSRVDAAQVEMANAAMGRIQASISGIGTQLAVQLSPYIDAAANKLVEFATSGKSAGDLVTSGLELVSQGIGFAADTVQMLQAGFKGMQSAVTLGLSVLAEWWGILGKGIESVLNLIPGVEVKFSNVLDQIGDDLRDLAGEQFEDFKSQLAEPPASEGVKAFFDDIKEDAAKTAQEIADAAANGKPFEGLGEDAVAAANKMKQLQSQAEQLFQSTRTPAEQFEQQLAKLNELKDLGLVDDDLFARGLEQAQEKLRNSAPKTEEERRRQQDDTPQFAKAESFGSAEGNNAIMRAVLGAGGGKEPEAKKTNAKLSAIEKLIEESNALLDSTKQNTKPNKMKPITIGS